MSNPVCAVLVADAEFATEFRAEIETVLGARFDRQPAQLGRQGTQRGIMFKLWLPGQESLGERFLDWTRPEGKPYQLGTLKPQAEIQAFVQSREEEFDGKNIRILANVEKYRAALAARVGQ